MADSLMLVADLSYRERKRTVLSEAMAAMNNWEKSASMVAVGETVRFAGLVFGPFVVLVRYERFGQ